MIAQCLIYVPAKFGSVNRIFNVLFT